MHNDIVKPDRRRIRVLGDPFCGRGASKPILLHKSNVGELAREIAQSHTAALGGDDAVVSAALDQAGIARFDESDTASC
ncbi:MAG TPA: hypothetical protein VM425_04010 [Myxococcota bacterium]|nr:hypothetical protein [Myxococcota bacterium]